MLSGAPLDQAFLLGSTVQKNQQDEIQKIKKLLEKKQELEKAQKQEVEKAYMNNEVPPLLVSLAASARQGLLDAYAMAVPTIKSIFNKLTIVMLACVLIPVLVQNIYSFFYTNPGR